MAQAINCDGPDSGPAVFVVHNIDAAEVSGFCLACFADFCQAFLQTVDPGRLAPPPAKPPRKSRSKPAAAVADDAKDGAGDDAGQPA